MKHPITSLTSSMIINIMNIIWSSLNINYMSGCLFQPLWKIWVRQLGYINISNWMGKYKSCAKPLNQNVNHYQPLSINMKPLSIINHYQSIWNHDQLSTIINQYETIIDHYSTSPPRVGQRSPSNVHALPPWLPWLLGCWDSQGSWKVKFTRNWWDLSGMLWDCSIFYVMWSGMLWDFMGCGDWLSDLMGIYGILRRCYVILLALQVTTVIRIQWMGLLYNVVSSRFYTVVPAAIFVGL